MKRYLWAIEVAEEKPVGELISDRYLLKQTQLVLDTKPGLTPQLPSEIPESLVPYLRLFPYRLHVPTVYGALGAEANSGWLLTYRSTVTDLDELLLPPLAQAWPEAAALRQLNWLWQMAALWQPLHSEGVASSLLAPALIRANRGIVQLLQLRQDEQPPTLKQLGQLWLKWLDDTATALQPFLQKLCQHLISKAIQQPEQLLATLEQGLRQGDRPQRTYCIFTATETGPSRDHNEDACFPLAGQTIHPAREDETLTIVCDGLGGQEGGEIAAQLAVEDLVEQIAISPEDDSNKLIAAIERAIVSANNVIAQRNDREQRHESQRMGTTLTLAIAHSPYLYFSHVGDSRIYFIHAGGCHQVTVDDDVASREVRRGYAIYQDAVQSLNAGALYQALGIYPSDFLQPMVQRLVLDEDCVFLLCSDGLSDNELVEQYWEEMLPIVQQQASVEQVGERLVKIANQLNGHDNITVALLYCQVAPAAGPATPIKFSLVSPPPAAQDSALPEPATEADSTTLAASLPPQRPFRYWLLLMVVAVLGLGAVAYWLFSEPLRERFDQRQERLSQSTIATRTKV
ncbi:MAG: protein phosphatase 2C domain-containing protein [Cyanophyceae cyanobacterium]